MASVDKSGMSAGKGAGEVEQPVPASLPRGSSTARPGGPVPVARLSKIKSQDLIENFQGPGLDRYKPSGSGGTSKPQDPFLLRLPIQFFAISLALCACSILWRQIVITFEEAGIPAKVHEVIWYIAVAFLCLLSATYACKAIIYPGAVRRELIHPIRSNFCRMPAVSIMALVASAPKSVTDRTCEPGKSVPVSAAYIIFAMMILLNLHSFRSWKLYPSRGMSLLKDMNPSCNVPVIANYLGAMVLGLADLYGPAFLLFTFGTMMWFVFFIAFFISIYMAQGAHNMFYVLPQPPHNVYFLMHVAPSVASMAWTAFAKGSLPEVSQAFYFTGIIMFVITAANNMVLLFREPPHVLIPWSMVFPVTAIPTSTRNYYNMRPFYELEVITHVLQFFQVFVLIMALMWTIVLARKGKIFVRDELMADVFPQQPVRSMSSRGLHAEGFGAEDGDGWSGSGEIATPQDDGGPNKEGGVITKTETDANADTSVESRVVSSNSGLAMV